MALQIVLGNPPNLTTEVAPPTDLAYDGHMEVGLMSATQPDRVPFPATILYQDKVTSVTRAVTTDDDLWLTLPDLTISTGWELKPEGVCRDDVCVPIPAGRASAFIQEEGETPRFNLAEFARFLEQPYARDTIHNAWYFGAPLEVWKTQLTPLIAPDFTLPDLNGNLYSLSDFRGKKVFLLCWASW